jgi:uncharacterized protein YjlB
MRADRAGPPSAREQRYVWQEVHVGDVIVVPAGVGHHNIGATDDFGVVGAYPGGRDWDLFRGLPGERPKADHNIAALPMPDCDPIYGTKGPLRQI